MCAKTDFITKQYRIEDLVNNELHKLPHSFVVLRNIFLRLQYKITHTKSLEQVKSCHIDFVVIGPPGVFVIEAKEWDENSYEKMVPYKEVDKAGLVVYIKLKTRFGKHFPVFNIITNTKNHSDTTYGRVVWQSVWDLSTFIYGKEEYLSKIDIKNIKRLFLKNR